jgi:hypothetical protein
MKALEGVKQATRVKGVNELQRVWQHRGGGADRNRPNCSFRCKHPERKAKSGASINPDD